MIMVKWYQGRVITKLILIYVHTKANSIKSDKQKAVFSFFLSVGG